MASLDTTFSDHVQEFRKRLLWVIVAVGLSAAIAYVIRIRLINILLGPLHATVYYTSPAGSFSFVLMLTFVIGAFIAIPMMIYHILRFIEPALPINISRGMMLKIIGASFFLALAGIAFGFFIMLPLSLHFFGSYSTNNVRPLINANEYLQFVLNHLITFALTFQIPMIFLFINRIKPLKPSQLLKYQRHVIVAAFAIAIVLPFTYDPLSQFVLAIPIVFLYYMSVLLIYMVNRKQNRQTKITEKKFVIAAPVVPAPSPKVPNFVPAPQIQTAAAIPRPRLSMDGFVTTKPRPLAPVAPVAIKTSLPQPKPQEIKTTGFKRLGTPKFTVDGVSPPLPSSI